jgi:hypothetical protein
VIMFSRCTGALTFERERVFTGTQLSKLLTFENLWQLEEEEEEEAEEEEEKANTGALLTDF